MSAGAGGGGDGDGGSGAGSSGGGLVKSALVVIGALVAGYLGLKLTFWLLKGVLWLAAIGGVGWLIYQVASGRLGSGRADTPRALPPGSDEEPSGGADDPLGELNAALRELEALKRRRGE